MFGKEGRRADSSSPSPCGKGLGGAGGCAVPGKLVAPSPPNPLPQGEGEFRVPLTHFSGR